MKIFVVPSVFPNKFNTQGGNFILNQCKILSEMGHDIVVIDSTSLSYKEWFDFDSFKLEDKFLDNIKVVEKHFRGLMLSKLPRIATLFYKKAFIKCYNYAVNKYGAPDVIYAHFTFTSGYVVTKHIKNIPCIVQEHASLLLNNKNKHITNYLNYTVNNCYNFLCVSKQLKSKVDSSIKVNKSKSNILYNTINKIYSYQNPVKKENFVFFSAANLIESKGFLLLIDSFINTFSINDKVELRIAGQGCLHEKLEHTITENNRSCQIKLLGTLNPDKMLSEYTYCDCFCLASHIETFGIVYREAMAVGRPIISVENNGIREDWDKEFGLIVENNKNALSTALFNMYNKNNYDGKKISNMTLKKFGCDIFKEKWLNIQKELEL